MHFEAHVARAGEVLLKNVVDSDRRKGAKDIVYFVGDVKLYSGIVVLISHALQKRGRVNHVEKYFPYKLLQQRSFEEGQSVRIELHRDVKLVFHVVSHNLEDDLDS